MTDIDVTDQVRSLLLTLWEADRKPGVKAWAIHIALTYAINKHPGVNKRDIWKLIQDEYQGNLKERFPDQEDTGQSYRRASGEAWEMFVEEYLNSNPLLKREGIRAVSLSGADFQRFTAALGVAGLRPMDVDRFLQGVGEDGKVQVFGALFPKASYAERIRADEVTSRKLMEKEIWTASITLDAREELGTEDRPSVKRRTINGGGFHGCYSFNEHTVPGPMIHIVRCTVRDMRNPLIRDIVHAWRARGSENHSLQA